MKKCPSCYAIMKETTTPTRVPKIQEKVTGGGGPQVPESRVRHECSQCGHTEESYAKQASR